MSKKVIVHGVELLDELNSDDRANVSVDILNTFKLCGKLDERHIQRYAIGIEIHCKINKSGSMTVNLEDMKTGLKKPRRLKDE